MCRPGLGRTPEMDRNSGSAVAEAVANDRKSRAELVPRAGRSGAENGASTPVRHSHSPDEYGIPALQRSFLGSGNILMSSDDPTCASSPSRDRRAPEAVSALGSRSRAEPGTEQGVPADRLEDRRRDILA